MGLSSESGLDALGGRLVGLGVVGVCYWGLRVEGRGLRVEG
jgi:hypothetical protein